MSAGTIVVAYVIAAVFWIALSDRVLAALVSDHGALVTFSTLKGWAFVAVTGAMLAAMLRRHDAQRTRQASEVEARDIRRSRERALIAEALEALRPLDTAEQTAAAICRRIVELPEIAMASLLLFEPDGGAMPLALTVDDGRVLDRKNLGSERSALRSGRGRIQAGGVERDVTFEEPEPDTSAWVTAAYHAKYDRHGPAIVGTVVSPEAERATLRLAPR